MVVVAMRYNVSRGLSWREGPVVRGGARPVVWGQVPASRASRCRASSRMEMTGLRVGRARESFSHSPAERQSPSLPAKPWAPHPASTPRRAQLPSRWREEAAMKLPGGGMSWKEFVKAMARETNEDNLTDWAGAVTYSGVMALFPFLLFLVALASLVITPAQAESV